MKNQWIKVPLAYVMTSAVYFGSALLLDGINDEKIDSGWGRLSNEISDALFWGNTIIIYIFSLMGSSLIGTLWYYQKSNQALFKGFGIMFIISVISFLLLMIFACMQ